MRHELHAKLFLYQPLLSLTAGLQPLPTDPWRYASRFPHLCHNCCLSFSLSLGLRVLHSTTRNLMRLALLAELLRNFLHCWIRWHGTMIWRRKYSCSTSLHSWSKRRPHRFCDSWLLHAGCESVLSLHVERMFGHCPSSSEPDSCHRVFFRISENDLEQQHLYRHGTGPLVFCLQAGLTWIPRMLQWQFLAIKNVPC